MSQYADCTEKFNLLMLNALDGLITGHYTHVKLGTVYRGGGETMYVITYLGEVGDDIFSIELQNEAVEFDEMYSEGGSTEPKIYHKTLQFMMSAVFEVEQMSIHYNAPPLPPHLPPHADDVDETRAMYYFV